MAVITLYRLAEECLSLIEGGDMPAASSVSINEVKIACGQVINQLLKVDYLSVNGQLGEKIPNGSVLALYEDIAIESWNGKSISSLPIKPLKLPRNMGVWAIYPKWETNGNYELDKEFIPLQMGQGGLLQSQPMINDLLGQVGYEVFGNKVVYTKDIPTLYPDAVVAMRMVVMDISQYGDYNVLPILPEHEWQVKQEVVKMYTGQPIPDKVVDSSVKELIRNPINNQTQPD